MFRKLSIIKSTTTGIILLVTFISIIGLKNGLASLGFKDNDVYLFIFFIGIILLMHAGRTLLIPLTLAILYFSKSILLSILSAAVIFAGSSILHSTYSHIRYYIKRYRIRKNKHSSRILDRYFSVFTAIEDNIPKISCSWSETDQHPIEVKSCMSHKLSRLISGYVLSKYESDFYVESHDHQVPGSRAIYADLLIESLLNLYQPVVEKATGLSVWPTYTTCRVYEKGHDLPKHHDRNACELTLTICIFTSSIVEDIWPIYIESQSGEHKEYKLDIGDGLIYKGIENHHWREPLKHDKQIQLLLHYVDKNGPFKQYKNDLRENIGDSELQISKYISKEKKLRSRTIKS